MDKIDKVMYGFIIFLIVFIAYCIIALIGTGEDIVLEGEITKVDVIKNAEGTGIEHYLTYMNDEPTSYKIMPSRNMDFTVNSEIIICMGKTNPRLPIFGNHDTYYISSITKIP